MADRRHASLLRFGRFELDLDREELRRQGRAVRLQPQPWRVLVELVTQAGRLVTREALQREVWGERAVEADQGLNYCIREIRRALGDRADRPTFIETVPRRGYRFIAPVEAVEAVEAVDRGDGPRRPASFSGEPPHGAEVETAVGDAPAARFRRSRKRWVLLLAVAGTLAAIAAAGLWNRGGSGYRGTRSLLAVLPFTVESADDGGEAELIASGLSYEVVTELGRLDRQMIGVLSLEATRRLAEDPRGIRALHEVLGADVVLRGTVRVGERTTHLNLWLESTEDDRLLWTQRFQAAAGEQIAMQRSLSERVAAALSQRLRVRLSAPIERAESPEARRAYLLARHLLDQGGEGAAERSAELFNRAITADPRSARSYAGLAEAIVATAERPRIESEGRAAAMRALALDPELASAHRTLAMITSIYDWDWQAAESHIERALDLSPLSASSHGIRAFLLLRKPGREERGIAAARRALELDPVSSLTQGDVAWAFFYARRFEAAIAQAETTLELDPNDPYAALNKVHCLRQLDRDAEAIAVARTMMERRNADPERLAELTEDDPDGGLHAFWRYWQGELEAFRERGFVAWDGLASTALQLGDRETALRLLSDSLEERPAFLLFLGVDPRFDPLRGDPAFEEIVRRIDGSGGESGPAPTNRGSTPAGSSSR